ncbi:ribonuclease HII [Subsaxibacter sp. CAU 1640]|uniref:ribonuclease HII n=1 Tax=Subsaxibacter sp. CAU 1640 TaxID=2933271 RepID=UPI00200442E0|nr:ribonuclease HII [Subsaxibacter sp. CAU 1640]MCK7588951.1 ribonuclease HII [Subsaxibacter sp. CAU 1640]
MKNLWFLILFFLIFYNCENDANQNSELITFVPENASIIIKTKSIEGLKSVFKNNDLLNNLSDYKTVDNIEHKLHYLKYLKPIDNVIFSFGKDSKDSLQIALITKNHKDLFSLDSVPNRTVESYMIEGLTIAKTTIDNLTLFSAVKDSIFFISNDKSLTESAFKNKKQVDPTIKSIFETANIDKSASILIKTNGDFKPAFFATDVLNKVQLSNYIMVDADLGQDQLIFNGITKAIDSSKSLINVFKNTVPQENKMAHVAPTNTDVILSFTFSNYKTFHDNLQKFTKSNSEPTSLFDTASEIGVIYRGNDQAIIINSLDASAMNDLLLTQNALETYREVAIYPYDQTDLFSSYFAPFITYGSASRYANIDDYFIFTGSDSLMKDIISSYQNSSTLAETPAFKNIMESMSDESSLFLYSNASNLNQLLNSNFSEEKSLSLDGFRASAIQFIQDSDFAHINAIIKKHKGKAVANSVSEDISVTLDNDLLTNPQFVDNHTNNQKEIVVQDIKNNLYLISNDGKVLWKKQLEGKVLGEIEQIDMYKNGRLQLVFATANRVYVLDRNGKDVSPFPLKFNDEITKPLSVFDYDSKRDYRLMVTQGKSVLMYDAQGKIVTGFTYKKAESTIKTQPKHFRIGRKDYIVFVQGQELEILDRVGKTRINVKNNISFSDNEIYVYNNKFTATTMSGDLIQIDENGKMSSMNLNLGEKHSMTATSKTLVTMSDNILNIKTHRVELDYGVYTAPKIFYLNDKIYISVTDLQTKKIYLFDSLGKEISNFPVYGNSAMELDNIDNGRGLEFVTKGDSNSILIYNMN